MKVVLNEGLPLNESVLSAIQAGADIAAQIEGISRPCAISLTVINDEEMRHHNAALRGIDRTTDVLSFPTVSYPQGKTAGQCDELLRQEYDDELDACFLGDILLSLPRAQAQAEEYGHSLERETVYLVIHGICHLFGYDHITAEDQKQMRQMEEAVMHDIGLARIDLSPTDQQLLQSAVEAMANAYAPYSHFTVGAAILGTNSTIYTGCNVENASFGLTNCAERTAIFNAISQGCRNFSAIAIASKGSAPWPCGACRQVLNEFSPALRILVTWDGHVAISSLQELLPHGFGPQQLPSNT